MPLSESLIGSFFNEVSISFINLIFQFNLTNCQVPRDARMMIIKDTNTVNKNLCFNLKLTTPNVDSSK